jgi:hypothetical protein
MSWRNPKSVESKIRRLTREIAAIDEFFYLGNENEDRVPGRASKGRPLPNFGQARHSAKERRVRLPHIQAFGREYR